MPPYYQYYEFDDSDDEISVPDLKEIETVEESLLTDGFQIEDPDSYVFYPSGEEEELEEEDDFEINEALDYIDESVLQFITTVATYPGLKHAPEASVLSLRDVFHHLSSQGFDNSDFLTLTFYAQIYRHFLFFSGEAASSVFFNEEADSDEFNSLHHWYTAYLFTDLHSQKVIKPNSLGETIIESVVDFFEISSKDRWRHEQPFFANHKIGFLVLIEMIDDWCRQNS